MPEPMGAEDPAMPTDDDAAEPPMGDEEMDMDVDVEEDDEEGGGDFVHEEVGFDLGLRLGGFEVSMFYSGYDLGLVDEENRSEVRENPPEEGTRDAASFVKLDSSLSIRYGPAVVLLAILPILWIISPSGGSFQPNNDESE